MAADGGRWRSTVERRPLSYAGRIVVAEHPVDKAAVEEPVEGPAAAELWIVQRDRTQVRADTDHRGHVGDDAEHYEGNHNAESDQPEEEVGREAERGERLKQSHHGARRRARPAQLKCGGWRHPRR